MPGPLQRPRERDPGPPGPDHANPQPCRMFASSSLHRYRTAPSSAGQRLTRIVPARDALVVEGGRGRRRGDGVLVVVGVLGYPAAVLEVQGGGEEHEASAERQA